MKKLNGQACCIYKCPTFHIYSYIDNNNFKLYYNKFIDIYIKFSKFYEKNFKCTHVTFIPATK